MAALPIVLFIDRGFPVDPFAAEFDGELLCREAVDDHERVRVVGLVTGGVPVGLPDVVPYPNLEVVLSCSTGTDHLAVAALSARGLAVRNTPTYCSEEVADHALACVLGAWRGLWRLDRGVREGEWEPATMLRRFDAQRLGVIGLGRIGRALARKARALGIEVVGHDPWAAAPEGVELLPLGELLSSSDAVSLHVPASPGAEPLLGAAELALMKPDAVLVNLSRAALVDLDAMVAALRRGELSGAAWDVWPQEPPATGDERLEAPGLLVTPHVGWSSPQADRAYIAEAVEALRSVLLAGADASA